MPSPYSPAAVWHPTHSLIDGDDSPSAALINAPNESLADNCKYLYDAAVTAAAGFKVVTRAEAIGAGGLTSVAQVITSTTFTDVAGASYLLSSALLAVGDIIDVFAIGSAYLTATTAPNVHRMRVWVEGATVGAMIGKEAPLSVFDMWGQYTIAGRHVVTVDEHHTIKLQGRRDVSAVNISVGADWQLHVTLWRPL